MRSPLRLFSLAGSIVVLSTIACLSTGDLLSGIGEPIPMGSPVVSTLDFQSWQPSAPVPIGASQSIGNLTLVVNNTIRPANHVADDASFYSEPDRGEEYVAVDITATCNLPADQTCRVVTTNFAVEGVQRVTYPAEIVLSGIGRAFESGEIQGSKARSGYLFFVVNRDDTGLVMRYPHAFGLPAQSISFSIDD